MWKENWDETREHYNLFWKQEGFVLKTTPTRRIKPWEEIPVPDQNISVKEKFTSPEYIALHNEYQISLYDYPADTLPLGYSDLGTVCLASVLGSKQCYSKEDNTVWYEPCFNDINRPIIFDAECDELKRIIKCLKTSIKKANGRYLVGAPGMSSGLDTLAALYEPQSLMMNLITDGDAVRDRLDEIHMSYISVMDLIKPICNDEWGGSTFFYFDLWGKGSTSQIQCDNAAMISPQMFEEYVIPYSEKQCEIFDNSLFHVDGTQCLAHVDALLKIEKLKAVEWTPQAGIEQGGNPIWYDLYKKILGSGKSVQALGVKPDEVIPLIKAIGKKGVYIMTTPIEDFDDAQALYEAVKEF